MITLNPTLTFDYLKTLLWASTLFIYTFIVVSSAYAQTLMEYTTTTNSSVNSVSPQTFRGGSEKLTQTIFDNIEKNNTIQEQAPSQLPPSEPAADE
ncbi:MAG: hypothetical protein HQK50_06555 [Oligoflexia bacterium]|nr:hypothetical protein [Oligoflexia bacterium]MBF0365213.1 hypothetical protein [Oligoflexia bacterium]